MVTTSLTKALKSAVDNENTRELAVLLGAESAVWRAALARLATSSLYVSAMLPDEPELDTVLIAENKYDDDRRLILSVEGPPMTGSMGIDPGVWPFEPCAHVAYSSERALEVTVGGHGEVIDCIEYDGRLVVRWPDELGIQGDIDLTGLSYAPGFLLTMSVRPSYPAYTVSKLILDSEPAYSILERAGYIEAFYQAALPSEKIAIAVLAVYKLQTQ